MNVSGAPTRKATYQNLHFMCIQVCASLHTERPEPHANRQDGRIDNAGARLSEFYNAAKLFAMETLKARMQ